MTKITKKQHTIGNIRLRRDVTLDTLLPYYDENDRLEPNIFGNYSNISYKIIRNNDLYQIIITSNDKILIGKNAEGTDIISEDHEHIKKITLVTINSTHIVLSYAKDKMISDTDIKKVLSFLFNDDKTIEMHNIPNIDSINLIQRQGVKSISFNTGFNPNDIDDCSNYVLRFVQELFCSSSSIEQNNDEESLIIGLSIKGKTTSSKFYVDTNYLRDNILNSDLTETYTIHLDGGGTLTPTDFITNITVDISSGLDIRNKIHAIFDEQYDYIGD